jgi:uncharacterized membrane protein
MPDLTAVGAAIVLLLVVALAVVVRLPGMDHRLLPDEGYTWLVASASGPGDFLHRLAAYENTPPLYYLLLTPLPLSDEVWIRLPSFIAGVALAPIVYALSRRALGRSTGLLAALLVAVAPYAVAESNFGRGFMLADLGLLCALWGAVRLAEGGSNRWWLLYAAGAILAMYSEYDSATTLVCIALGLVVLLPPPRWTTFVWAVLPALTFVPWIHQLARSLRDLDVTKTGIGYLTVTPAAIRDQLVNAFYGSTGTGLSAPGRTLALLVLLAVLAYGAIGLHRLGERARPLTALVAIAGSGTFALHALAPAVNIGIFNVGYLTFLIPLGCIVIAQAVATVPVKRAVPIAAAALVVFGAAFTVKRMHNDSEPDPHTISALTENAHARTILTNSAVIDYYLRNEHVILDRPFGLGPDRETGCPGCIAPIAVVDDADVGNGSRPGPGATMAAGHYTVRVLPAGLR